MQIQEQHKQAKIEAKASKKKKIERIPTEKGAPEIEQKDRRTKVRSKILHMMILGPNTLKTHFWAYYPFFRNPEPWPTLRT